MVTFWTACGPAASERAPRLGWLRRGEQVVAICWLHEPTGKVVSTGSRGTVQNTSFTGPVAVTFSVTSPRHGRRDVAMLVSRHLLLRARDEPRATAMSS